MHPSDPSDPAQPRCVGLHALRAVRRRAARIAASTRSTARSGRAAAGRRQGGEWEFRQPKSGKAQTVIIPEPLVRELEAQWREQKKLKEMAGGDWTELDHCFPNSLGKSLEPHDDWQDWKWLCKAASIRDARHHDARDTAATLLLGQGVCIGVAQEILGYSIFAVTKRHTHVTSRFAKEAAERTSRAPWDMPDDDKARAAEK